MSIKTVIGIAVGLGLVIGIAVGLRLVSPGIVITPDLAPTSTVGTPQASTTGEQPPVGVEDRIRVSSPLPNDFISSPLTVTGEARGYWYFEASFPVELLDPKGKQIAIIPAQAQGEWMTEDFVPFTVKLTFKDPGPGVGTLVLRKDNPSGLPEHDAELRIPVRFEPPSAAGGDGEKMPPCIKSGCSGEVCSDREVATTCIYRPEYACYKTAKCARQENGSCGWTQSTALIECLAKYPEEYR